MKTSNPNWTFHFEVLSRALEDLESTCTARPGSPEFMFLRAESAAIFAEAREALAALKKQVRALHQEDPMVATQPTAH